MKSLMLSFSIQVRFFQLSMTTYSYDAQNIGRCLILTCKECGRLTAIVTIRDFDSQCTQQRGSDPWQIPIVTLLFSLLFMSHRHEL